MMHQNSIPWLDGFYLKKEFYYFLAYSGFLFGLLIVPLLLWKRTRIFALILSALFHLFNACIWTSEFFH